MSRTLLSLRSVNKTPIRLLAQSSNPNAGMVRTPVPLFGTDGRYVSALYSAASKQKKLDVVDNELKQLLLATKDHRFKDILFNPLIKAKEKKDLINKCLPSLNLSQLTLNLIGVMAENGKMKFFPKVVKTFNTTMCVARGELECTVTTAKPLDANTRKDVEQSLNGFAKGKKLSLTMKVDPNILGGMIVDFGGEHYIDMSIKTKFNFYSNLIKQAV